MKIENANSLMFFFCSAVRPVIDRNESHTVILLFALPQYLIYHISSGLPCIFLMKTDCF